MSSKISPLVKIQGIQSQGYRFLSTNAAVMEASMMALSERDPIMLRLTPDSFQLVIKNPSEVSQDFKFDSGVDYVDILISPSLTETKERVQTLTDNLLAFLTTLPHAMPLLSFFDLTIVEIIGRDKDFYCWFEDGGKFQLGTDEDIIPIYERECKLNRGYAVDCFRLLYERFGRENPYTHAQELIALFLYDEAYRIYQSTSGRYFSIKFDGMGKKYIYHLADARDALDAIIGLICHPATQYDPLKYQLVARLLGSEQRPLSS